jgi:hypothetical protein
MQLPRHANTHLSEQSLLAIAMDGFESGTASIGARYRVQGSAGSVFVLLDSSILDKGT